MGDIGGRLPDAHDLKDLIRVQRTALQSLREEQASLKSQLEEQEKIAKQVKSKLHVSLQAASVMPSDENLVSDEVFLEADAKLEVKILIPEIRKALPLLEKEVLEAESIAHHHDMNSTKIGNDADAVPAFFNRTEESISRELEDTERKVTETKERLLKSLDCKKNENEELSRSIASAQKKLFALLEEKALLLESRDLYEITYEAERTKVQLTEANISRLEDFLEQLRQ